MKKRYFFLLILVLLIPLAGGCSSNSATDKTPTGTGTTPPPSTTPPITVASQASNITVTATPPSGDVSAGATVTIKATLKDSSGANVDDGTTVDFAITTNAALGAITPTATTVSGIATATFTANNIAGTAEITVTSQGVSAKISLSILGADVGSIVFSSATPNVIGIKEEGQPATSLIVFEVKDVNGNPALDGTSVTFSINGPNGGEFLVPTTASTTGGTVQTTLQSGFVAGPVRVQATTNVAGKVIVSSSTGVSIGGGVASATHIDLAASIIRLAGFSYLDLNSDVTAFLSDRFGNFNVLTGTSTSFYTEAGAIDRNNVTDEEGRALVKFRTQAPDPLDVSPGTAATRFGFGGETSYPCAFLKPLNCNPRDGWVTVLMTTIGEEEFTDANGNGVFDLLPAPEPFVDLGEPFIDRNDNGIFDLGEFFVDFDNNGAHSAGDGQWSGETMIWTEIRLTMVGETSFGANTSRFTDSTTGAQVFNFAILNGASRTFNIFVSDFNQNLLPPGSTITITKEGGGVLTGGGTFILGDGLSFGPTVISVTLSDADAKTKKQEGASIDVEITEEIGQSVGSITHVMSLGGFVDFGPAIITDTLDDATATQAYNFIVEAGGGTNPFTWSALGLPAGLSINPTTGIISGTTATAGTFNVLITVTDSTTPTALSDTKAFKLKVL